MSRSLTDTSTGMGKACPLYPAHTRHKRRSGDVQALVSFYRDSSVDGPLGFVMNA